MDERARREALAEYQSIAAILEPARTCLDGKCPQLLGVSSARCVRGAEMSFIVDTGINQDSGPIHVKSDGSWPRKCIFVTYLSLSLRTSSIITAL